MKKEKVFRLLTFLFMVLTFIGAGYVLMKYVDFSMAISFINDIGNYWFILLPIIMILILYISYKISEGIYRKKEF